MVQSITCSPVLSLQITKISSPLNHTFQNTYPEFDLAEETSSILHNLEHPLCHPSPRHDVHNPHRLLLNVGMKRFKLNTHKTSHCSGDSSLEPGEVKTDSATETSSAALNLGDRAIGVGSLGEDEAIDPVEDLILGGPIGWSKGSL
ncbi:hypothetical protein VTL71DRAFT_9673 [Oculimacula yallundae]|uniref:Uncharacterized protein n=1 Tax=Oculimacula yallundae TaxID=86028 RepID=A0ABR4BUC8_9HELO